ncbi:MAG: hypothetical protein ACTIJ6_03985 [Leucobacter sp.]
MNTKKQAKKLAESTSWNPLRLLNGWGIRSSHAYSLGALSIGLSLMSWLFSRGKDDSKSQSDRWGLFFGEWAPTLFALGVGLKMEEES